MNEVAILGQVKFLYDHEMYSNIVSLNLWLTPLLEKGNDVTSPNSKFQLMVYLANSHFRCMEYKKAEATYQSALQLRKSVGKTRGKQEISQDVMAPDMDVSNIKYQIHLCHVSLKQFPQAITTLETIPAKLRTSRVNMALGKLYQQSGQERSSITAYKEVVKECPLALEAAKGLLSLGVKGAEVSSLMLSSSANISSTDWLPLWIKAHAQLYSREYSQCLASIKQLESKTILINSVDLLVLQGEAHYYNGDYKQAEAVLERAHTSDPHLLNGMDIYALLLAKEKKVKELESLSTHLISTTDEGPEPWFAMALLCQVTRKTTRAVYFAQKACIANPRSVEALLLKGFILMDLRKLQEAAFHFREALKIAPYRYQPHKGLVECHMAMGRTREAIAIASNACKQLGSSARALTLYASVLVKDPITRDKARSLLEKALKVDNTYLPAVFKLIYIYEQEKEYHKGIELLKKQIEMQSCCKLHQHLAELLCRTKDNEKALDHYSIALNFEPNNTRVLEGMHRVEQQSDLADSSYDVADSDNEEGIESEVEADWSDVDFS